MNEIKNRKEFIENFGFKVVPCGKDKKPYGKWDDATINPNIDTDCYACFAGGTQYKDGVFVVIDLDNHKAGVETGRDFWNRYFLNDETFLVRTPSGGEHLYFLATEEQVAELKNIKPTGTRIAEQVEMFWNGKHLNNAPFSKTDNGEYVIEKNLEFAPLPDRVIELFRQYNKPKNHPVSSLEKQGSIDEMERRVILNELVRLAEDGEFNDYDTWVGLMLAMRNSGFITDDAEQVSWGDEPSIKKIDSIWREPQNSNDNKIKLGSIIYRWVPRFTDKEWLFEKLEEVVISSCLNQFSFLHKIKLGTTTGILDLSGANKALVRDYKNTLACYQSKEYRTQYPKFERRTHKISWKEINGFDVWWKEAEALEGLKTSPYKPMGEIEENGYRYFNDWEDAPTKSGEGTPELFYDHLLNNVCDGNEITFNYLKHWIWDLIATPQHKNNIAVAITGKQGCGKSSVFKALGICFHSKYTATIDNTEQLIGKFDADWKSCALVAVEEACFAGDRKSGVWGKMKSLITDSETSIEKKNFDRYKKDSMLHFIITGNDVHIVPKEKGDRRYLVLECNDNKLKDVDFFKQLFYEMENGGAKKLIEEAQRHAEEARCFPFHNIPITTIGVENQRESADFVLQWLIDQIENYAESDDSIFKHLSNGEVAFWTKDVVAGMKENGNINKFEIVNLGRKLPSYFGMPSKQLKIDGKNHNGFRFSGFDEMKERISNNYFNGQNPFKENTIQGEEVKTELGEMLSSLK